MRVHQWKTGPMQNFVYVLVDDARQAMLVDPSFEVPRVLRQVDELRVRVTHILATHGHHDHVDGIPAAKDRLGAMVVAHESADHPAVDQRVKHGDSFSVGQMRVQVLHTPGHRFDAVCYLVEGTHLLTGDTLFVGECGRVDLPGSDPRAMHHSLLSVLRSLPDELIVLPGHDYGRTPTSTMGREKQENHTLKPRTLDEFLAFMAEP
ncbi:MAG: MBL fold metallo-hydrolase [Candidatus Thermoplasmatota archaeon]